MGLRPRDRFWGISSAVWYMDSFSKIFPHHSHNRFKSFVSCQKLSQSNSNFFFTPSHSPTMLAFSPFAASSALQSLILLTTLLGLSNATPAPQQSTTPVSNAPTSICLMPLRGSELICLVLLGLRRRSHQDDNVAERAQSR